MACNANDASIVLQLIEEKNQLKKDRDEKFSFPRTYCIDYQLEQNNFETFSEANNCKAISKAIATD